MSTLDDESQAVHDQAKRDDPDHDRVGCVCCCFDCEGAELAGRLDDGVEQ